MNTLEEAQLYFQSKGYKTAIHTFNPDKLMEVESQLIIQGQKMAPIPDTDEPYYRVRVAIGKQKTQWQFQPPYFQRAIEIKALAEAVQLAESILGSPVSERSWEDSISSIEEAKTYLEAQGYSTEFLPPTSKRLVIYGLKTPNPSIPNGFDFGNAVMLTAIKEGWMVDRPFLRVPSKHARLVVAVVFAEDMVGPPFKSL
jgi:hypothetical protein